MLSRKSVWSFAVVLSLLPSLAWAAEPLEATVKRQVDEGLIKPLAAKELDDGKFSRARMPPRERRVRVIDATATPDKDGREYVAFAVDVRFGKEWRENDVVGCAYVKTGDIFVKRGTEHRPAAFLLGKNVAAVAGVCAPAQRA